MERMSARQRKRFRARGIDNPRSTFLPPSSPKKSSPRRADTGPDEATVDMVIARDDGCCVVCGKGIDASTGRGMFWSIQHRKHRAHGVDNRTSNLALMCGSGTTGCHGEAERKPDVARLGGWAILSTDDPEQVPMAHASAGGYVLLDNEGGMTPTDRRPEVG